MALAFSWVAVFMTNAGANVRLDWIGIIINHRGEGDLILAVKTPKGAGLVLGHII